MRTTISRRDALATLAGGVALAAAPLRAQPTGASGVDAPDLDAPDLDAIVARFRAAFGIPGIGIAIVRPGAAPFARGYGVRRLGDPAPVDAHTQFAIASNSKAFLSACFAMLVDAGRLGWDDPVVRHLPEFAMYDPAVTRLMTVRDLFVHRSGLALGAGDLMQFPISDRSAADILAALPHFRQARGFRAGYAYDNVLYIVAGILLERVAGLGWDAFVAQRILAPLGMADAVTNPTLVRGPNHAARHARLGPPVRGMGALEVVPPDETALVGPAGGINVSVAGVVPWLQVQLARGALPDGRRLWSAAQSAEMWTPQTITASTPGPTAEQPERPVIAGYALGWGVGDYRGRRMIRHSGGLVGQITQTALLPEQGIGFVVYTNTEDGAPVSALRYAIADHLLGVAGFDWVAHARADIARDEAEVRARVGGGDFVPPPGGPTLPLERYAGRYRDPWYGDVVVTLDKGMLAIDFTHTPVFKSRLEPFGPDAFRTRFARGVGEDAVVRFAVADGAVTGATMAALSPLADFSFDFADLAFARVR